MAHACAQLSPPGSCIAIGKLNKVQRILDVRIKLVHGGHFSAVVLAGHAAIDNGQWLRAESYLIDQSKLPSSVSQAINKEFTGYTIKDVDREDNATQVLYEVELQKGTDKCKIHYATDGSVVKKKCRIAGVKTKDKATSSR